MPWFDHCTVTLDILNVNGICQPNLAIMQKVLFRKFPFWRRNAAIGEEMGLNRLKQMERREDNLLNEYRHFFQPFFRQVQLGWHPRKSIVPLPPHFGLYGIDQ
jgi:hypothetical protein